MSDEPGVTVSLDEIYRGQLAMQDDMSKMKGLLERHVALQEQTNTSIETRLENHGTRLGNHDTDITGLSNRMLTAEGDIKLLKDVRERRPSWTSVATAIVAIVGGGATIIGLFITLNNIGAALQTVAP